MKKGLKQWAIVAFLLVIWMVPKSETSIAFAANEEVIQALDAYYQAGDAVLEDSQYVLAPEHDYALDNRLNDRRSSVTYGVHFSLSGAENYEPGTVTLRIPAKIFQGRDGSYAANSSTILPIPEEGQSNSTDYAYHYDAETEEYVITNIRTLSSACEATFNIKYFLQAPSLIENGSYTRDYKVSLNVTGENGLIDTAEASAENIRIDTRFDIKGSEKSVYRKYETFPGGWGEPTEADKDDNGDGITDDSFYVVYRILTLLPNTNTQPAVLKVEDFPETGEVVGYRSGRGSSSSKTSSDLADPYGTVSATPLEYDISQPECYYENYYATFVLVRYKRADLKEGDSSTYQLKNRAVSGLYGTDSGEPVTKEASATYTYVPPKGFKLPSSYASISKTGNGLVYGGVAALKAGHTLTFRGAFTNTATVSHYEKTYQEPEGLTTEEEKEAAKQNPSNYGKQKVRTELVDDLFYFQDHYTDPLASEDYELTEINLMTSNSYMWFYKYGRNPETGDFQRDKLTGEGIPDLELWLKSAGDDTWKKFGTYHMNVYWRFQYEDGTEIRANGEIKLPEGTVGVKLVTENVCESLKVTYRVGMKLHSTEHILNLLGDTVPGTTTVNRVKVDSYSVMDVNTLLVYDADGTLLPGPSGTQAKPEHLAGAYERDKDLYGEKVGHATATTTFCDFPRQSGMNKQLSSYENDTSNKLVRLHYELNAYESLSYGNDTFTAEELGDAGILKEQRKGTFYDLLPLGCEPDPSTLKVTPYYPTKYGLSEYLAAMDEYEVKFRYELEENWRDTGRTMLKIYAETPDNVRTYAYKNRYSYQQFSDNCAVFSGYTATFDLIYPWDAVADYGVDLLNSAAYQAEKNNLSEGNPDDGGKITEAELLKDLDGDGNPEGISSDYLYGEAKTKLNVVTATELDLSKRVRKKNGQWTDGLDGSVVLEAGDSYEYRLRVGSAKNTTTEDVILFDAIEQYHPENGGEQWRGILTGVDVTQPKNKGADPVIYYSTAKVFEDPAQLEKAENRDLTDSVLWTTDYPKDPSEITAVAIDLRKDKSGNDFVLPEQQTIQVLLKMKVPDEITESVLKKAHAYNNIYLSNTLTDTLGTKTSMVIHAEYTKVGLKEIEHAYELPDTGGAGIMLFLVGGGILLSICFAGWRRKEKLRRSR